MSEPKYSSNAFIGTFWTIIDGDHYVSTLGSDIDGDGSPKNPYLTINRALGVAMENDKVVIGPNEYIVGGGEAYNARGPAQPCRLATIGNINLSVGGVVTVDGQLSQTGDRVLVWKQDEPTENGIYIVQAGPWPRAQDLDSPEDIVPGEIVPVLEGANHANRIFQNTTQLPVTLESTPITFTVVSASGGSEIPTIEDISGLQTALDAKADLAALDTHTSDTTNPHSVTKEQVNLGNVDNTSDANKPVSNAQQAAIDAKADRANVLELNNTASYTPVADYHPATKKYVEDQLATLDRATPMGLLDASTNPNYPQGSVGDYYYISVAGKVGGSSGVTVQMGDKLQCIADNSGGSQAAVGSSWIIFQGNLDKATTTEAEAGVDDEKYMTSKKGYEGWYSWSNNRPVSELSTVDKTIIGAINELNAGGSSSIFVDDISFATSNGVLTLTRSDASTLTVDLDGRYLRENQTISLNGQITGSGRTSITAVLSAAAITAQTALTSGLAATDELLVNDSGVLKRMDISVLQSYMQANLNFDTGTDNYTTGVQFNSSTGVLTLDRGSLLALTVDLDGRYLTGNQNISLEGQLSGSGSSSISAALTSAAITAQAALSSGLVATDELLVSDGGSLRRMDISVLQTYMQASLNFSVGADDKVSNVLFNTGTGVLTLNRSTSSDLSVDLDGRYALSSHNHAASNVTSGTFANARISKGNVTQHQAALSIGWSQITGKPSFLPTTGGTISGGLTVQGELRLNATGLSFGFSSDSYEMTVSDDNPAWNGASAGATVNWKGDNADYNLGHYAEFYHASHHVQAASGFYVGAVAANGTQVIDGSRNIYAGSGTFGGNITWNASGLGPNWSMNTDGAYIRFFNTGDSDTNSRLEYAVFDNNNEYHRWLISNVDVMNLRSNALNVNVDLYIPDQIIHTGDTNTYMQFHAADQWRVVTGGAERLEVNNSEVFVSRPIRLNGHNLRRSNHHTGHLEGSYNNIGANSLKSNPIYTIGSNYNPSDAALGNMYGIGYSHTNAAFIGQTAGGNGWGMYVAADGNARIFLNGTTGKGVAIDWIATSDERLKQNIRPFGNVLDKILGMRGSLSLFDWKTGAKDDVGYTAQRLRSHFPNFVQEGETMGVSYGKLSAVALEGVAEVHDELNRLREEVKELKAKLSI